MGTTVVQHQIGIDIDTDALVQSMSFIHLLDIAIWDFLTPPKDLSNAKNTISIFEKLYKWIRSQGKADLSIQYEFVSYLQDYLCSLYKIEFNEIVNHPRLNVAWSFFQGMMFERLKECGFDVYEFFVFMHHPEVLSIDTWTNCEKRDGKRALLSFLYDMFIMQGWNASKIAYVIAKFDATPSTPSPTMLGNRHPSL